QSGPPISARPCHPPSGARSLRCEESDHRTTLVSSCVPPLLQLKELPEQLLVVGRWVNPALSFDVYSPRPIILWLDNFGQVHFSLNFTHAPCNLPLVPLNSTEFGKHSLGDGVAHRLVPRLLRSMAATMSQLAVPMARKTAPATRIPDATIFPTPGGPP